MLEIGGGDAVQAVQSVNWNVLFFGVLIQDFAVIQLLQNWRMGALAALNAQ